MTHLIAVYGYWAVFLFVTSESLGIPIPGETALIVAATYAGRTHALSPWTIFLVASAAAIIGDTIGFWAGDIGGYRLVRKYGHRIRLDDRKLKIGMYVFKTHGVKVVFFGRFISVLRTYAAFLAGTSRMRWRRFLPANASGGIIWAGVITCAAYIAGNVITGLSRTVDLVLGVATLLAVATTLFLVRRQVERLSVLAEAAYPGPLE
ncbi:MAG: DedA family protein [Acidimicrobiales bacterium]|jgi:membrane protein DedA with SNARE-associated domain